MTVEDITEEPILEKVRENESHKLYCCVCGEYLCMATVFQMFIVHFDCRNEEIRYYNVKQNRPLQ